MSNPFARLASSLANAVLDLGLPAIRAWLRERLGPNADVANVTTDGSIVSLEGVRIPIGPRGLVVLERAAATITSLGDDGPALRLHSFTGVLVFGPLDAPAFRADIAFAAGDEPDPAAWIWGDVAIQDAVWASESPAGPLHGAARLFVSSREWRIEGGRLDGGPSSGTDAKPPVVARFAAAGSLETGAPPLATLALALEHARVGPFLDAATALAGGSVQIPAAVPRDTRLDGELSWSSEAGARAELRLDAATIGARATVRAACAADGGSLTGNVDGTVTLAALLRRIGAPVVAIPREEDVVAVTAIVSGHVRSPEAQIDLRAPQIGFRFGRPRFVPAAVLRDLTGSIVLKAGRAVGQARLLARASAVEVDLEAERGKASVAVRGDVIEAAFLRDVVCAVGAKLTIPEDWSASFAIVHDGALRGTIGLTTARSRLVAQLGPVTRITGGVIAEDVVATGVLAGAAVFPSDGDFVVALDVDAAWRARGSLAAAGKVELTIGGRADIPPYVVEGAHADLTIDRSGIAYEGLRFTAYDGRFAGYGTVRFASSSTPAPPYLVLALVQGGLPLANELFLLLPTPRPAIAFPPDLAWGGQLTLAADLALAIDLTLTTPAGTDLAAAVRLRSGDLGGSTAKGALAVADAIAIANEPLPLDPEGLLLVDADVAPDATYRIAASSARVSVPPVALEDVSASVVVVANGDVFWNRADARLADGRVSSFGVARRSGEILARVSAASVAVHALPVIAGRTPSSYVRGRASGSAIVRRDADRVLAARGDVVLDEASFPIIDRARPALQRYGLRPPSEDATSPAVATIAVDARGLHVSDIAVGLHGAGLRGAVDILGPARALDGKVEIVLEEEYLRTSKLLTLPRVLGERLVLPVKIGGTIDTPDVHAELGHTLGRFLRESKVADFVTSAVEEAQLLFGRDGHKHADAVAQTEPPPSRSWETELRAAVDARADDWDALAKRR